MTKAESEANQIRAALKGTLSVLVEMASNIEDTAVGRFNVVSDTLVDLLMELIPEVTDVGVVLTTTDTGVAQWRRSSVVDGWPLDGARRLACVKTAIRELESALIDSLPGQPKDGDTSGEKEDAGARENSARTAPRD